MGSLHAIRALLKRGADPLAYVLGTSVNPDANSKPGLKRSTMLARSVMSAWTRKLAQGGAGLSPSRFSKGRPIVRVSATTSPGAAAPTTEGAQQVRSHWRSAVQRAMSLTGGEQPNGANASPGGADGESSGMDALGGKPQIRLGAVNVALTEGNLLCAAELLEWEWRAQGQVHWHAGGRA